MFLGEFVHSVDTKGRLAIPARFRSKLERGAVLVHGPDLCLYVYPMDDWERKAGEIVAAIDNPRQRRLVERRFFGSASELELDAQGRVIIPTKSRQYAGISGEAMVVGVNDRLEIWSTDRWQVYTDEMAEEDLTGLPLPF
jgi:MraZ protein